MKSSSHRKSAISFGSTIGTSTRISGNLFVDESIIIEGMLEGNLEQKHGDSRWVVIKSNGKVHGDITAQNISVAGEVLGNIIAGDNAELLDGCEVRGNITHKSINVEPGAIVYGQLIAIDQESSEEKLNKKVQ